MSTVLARFAAIAMTAAVAACAANPPSANLTAPPQKPLDAKTQLENGKRM